ncbi:hypothetical protein C4D60_Mb02t15930 [Musa balbisiana]|uniref:Uncharacterized protein n=1 Tax=Musa balbisiana TaxID=52838 RepID=A0A4S8IB09_MUSBA|nr:hypothetical protein C4D60_Mb02t15930 [Musa balbisiana]
MDPRSAVPYPSQVVCPDSAFNWLPLAAFLFLTCNSLNYAYQSRHDPRALFIVSSSPFSTSRSHGGRRRYCRRY